MTDKKEEDKVIKKLEEDNPELYKNYVKDKLIKPIVEKEEDSKSFSTPKSIAPMIQQIIFTDLGNYGGIHTGIDKYFYLMKVIETLSQHLMVNYSTEWFYKEIEREFKNSPLKFKTWQEFYKYFEKIKPNLNRVKIYYDDVRGRKEIPKEKQVKINSLVRKVTPYQFEISYMFNILMKISGIQRHTIPKQYFRTIETSKYVKTPFERSKPTVEDRMEDRMVREGERA